MEKVFAMLTSFLLSFQFIGTLTLSFINLSPDLDISFSALNLKPMTALEFVSSTDILILEPFLPKTKVGQFSLAKPIKKAECI